MAAIIAEIISDTAEFGICKKKKFKIVPWPSQ